MKKIPSLLKTVFGISLVFAASSTLVNCDDTSKSTSSADTTLYGRLGGTPAITAVIDSFLPLVLKDTVINARFNTLPASHIASLRQQLIDLVGYATGGNVKYGGKDMKTAHTGMNIKSEEFDALVGDMVASLNKNKVPSKEQGELGTILVSLKPQVVGQ
ncbi:MAG TPA: group 1 truncated hemoglobin [Fibrobacteres bacterium]|jgi:hemoglobin|nr:group 1 truncated hemoglobin [Fibrobacterota bacterium]